MADIRFTVKRWSYFFASLVFLISILVLLGWQLDIDVLKRFLPGLSATNPTTAVLFQFSILAFMVLSYNYSALWLVTASRVLVLVIFITGVVRLLAVVFDIPLPVDQLLFSAAIKNDSSNSLLSNMAPSSAFNFIQVGVVLMLLRSRYVTLVQVISLLIFTVSLFALAGYLYRVPEFYGLMSYFPMAFHTAVCFLLFAIAVFFATGEEGIIKELTGRSAGSNLARIIIPAAIVFPILFGYIRLWFYWKVYFSTEFGVLMLVISIVVFFTTIVWINVSIINKQERRLVRSDSEIQELNTRLRETNLKLEDSNHELLAANEELATANEELSSNVDELQLINEQLGAANIQIEEQNRIILLQKDEELNRVLDSSNDVIWSFDLTGGGRNYISRSAEKIYGEPIEHLLKRPQFWMESIIAEDRSIKAASQQRLREMGYTECTYRILRNGKVHWMHDRLRLIKNDRGEEQRLEGIASDISHLKEAEEKLSIIFSNTKEDILLLDREGKVVLFNNAFEEFIKRAVGYSPSIGSYLWDTTVVERREASKTLFSRALNGEALTVEASVVIDNIKIIHELRYEPVWVDKKVKYVTIISFDITEKKKKEEALRKSEAELRAIFQSTLDGLILIDTDYNIITFNNAAKVGFERYLRKELRTGFNIIELLSPTRKDAFLSHLQNVERGGTEEYEINYETGGEAHWFKIVINQVRDDQGSVIGFCFASHDLTSRKMAENALRESEVKFRALVENSGDIFAITNDMGVVTYISPNIYKILGYRLDEFVNLKAATILHPDEIDDWKNDTDEMAKNIGKTYQFTRRIKHKDGEWRWLEGTSINLMNIDGVKGRVSVYHDITSRISMEHELRTSAAMLADFQNAIHRSSIVSRADKEGNITFVNDNFVNISGFSREELVGQNHRIINSGFHSLAFWREMWRVISRGKIWREEVKNKAKGGTYYWVDTFVMPFLDESGHVKEYLSIRNDITGRKAAEEEVQQSRVLLEKADEVAHVGYWIRDFKTGKIIWSKETLKIFGVLAGDFDGRAQSIYKLVFPEDRKFVRRSLEKSLNEKRTFDIDHRIIRPDGIIRWVHEKAEAVRDASGGFNFIGIVQDITERKISEEILKEYNQRYEFLSRATNDAVWDWDIRHDFEIWNHGLESIFGYTQREIPATRKWWKDKIHPEDYDRVMEEINAAFRSKENNLITSYSYKCANGSYKSVLDRAYIVYDNEANPIRMIGAMQDVTERTQYLEEIRKLSLVARSTENSVMITDAQSRIEWVNESFTKLTGYSFDEVIGKTSRFLQGPDTDTEALNRINLKLQKRESFTEELINYTKSGKRFWLKLSIAPVFDEKRELKQFISVQTDISEQKEYEKSITAIARELANLIENANVPILGLNRSGYINEWNHITAGLLGFSREEVFGKKWMSHFVTGENEAVFDALIYRALGGESISNIEMPMVNRHGKNIVLLMSMSPRRDGETSITGVIIVAQNITELSEYREDLEKKVAERTHELNNALLKEKELVDLKSRFVSIASHEFRTPLSSISLASGFIRKYKQKIAPDEIDKKLENIEKQVRHMTYLLDDVLMIGKSEAGKIKVNLSNTNIGLLLTNIITEVTQSTLNTHEVNCEMRLGEEFVTDEKLMRNIIINLLTNAIKFSPDATSVEFRAIMNEKGVSIKIKDFGIGIPPEEVGKLFEPFYRAGNVAEISGTGLGLSIIKKAVDLLKGQVEVESKLNEGTEFTITLPFLS